jgi:uncharacterized membrane protein
MATSRPIGTTVPHAIIVKPPGKKKRPSFFFRGLAILLPSILTLWILWYALVFVFNNVAEPINGAIRAACIRAVPAIYSEAIRPQWYVVTDAQVAQYRDANSQAASPRQKSDDQVRQEIRRSNLELYWRSQWHLQATGLVVAVTLIYLAGVFLGGFVGRQLYARLERLIAQVPGFKQIYPHVKQLVELILGDTPVAFSRVVMVQFPRTGSWVLAFVTGNAMTSMAAGAKVPCLTVFVPTTPTPFTGFTLTVAESDVIDLPISIDEAVRYVITGGVLVPESQVSSAPKADVPVEAATPALPGADATRAGAKL